MTVDYLSALNTGGSGLNIKQIVDSIVNAETAPKKDLIDKKSEKQNIAISDLATVVSDLNDLKRAAQIGNPNIDDFEDSVFSGNYCTGDITKAFLQKLERSRGDSKRIQ